MGTCLLEMKCVDPTRHISLSPGIEERDHLTITVNSHCKKSSNLAAGGHEHISQMLLATCSSASMAFDRATELSEPFEQTGNF